MKYGNVTDNFILFQTYVSLFVFGCVLEDFDVIMRGQLPENDISNVVV